MWDRRERTVAKRTMRRRRAASLRTFPLISLATSSGQLTDSSLEVPGDGRADEAVAPHLVSRLGGVLAADQVHLADDSPAS